VGRHLLPEVHEAASGLPFVLKQRNYADAMPKKVLCLLAPGFEEIETVAPIDLLRRAGAEVTIASLTGCQLVTGRNNITVQADAALADVAAREFDLLLIPGGPGVKALRMDGRPAQLARAYVQAGKPVAAICAAPTVLADAGLLAGKRFTAHFSVHGELPQALAAERVVEDGNLITSRGAGTAADFGLALVRRLFGEATAQEVAKTIMA
jgi:4-methyl-5(b-hydroxyethyl)-thiazole monophosphate biosynthesis